MRRSTEFSSTTWGKGSSAAPYLSFSEHGRAAADLAVRALKGGSATAAIDGDPSARRTVDAGMLKRWRISERALPPGCEVVFRQPSWGPVPLADPDGARDHRIAGGFDRGAVATTTSFARGRARTQSRTRRRDARGPARDPRGVVGIDCTCNQSTARRDSEQRRRRCDVARRERQTLRPDRGTTTDLGRCAARHAARAEVVRRVRALAQQRTLELQPLEVNDVVLDAVRLLQADAERRSMSFDLILRTVPMVGGDRVQLQQVLIDLLMNAMDSMVEMLPARRRVSASYAPNHRIGRDLCQRLRPRYSAGKPTTFVRIVLHDEGTWCGYRTLDRALDRGSPWRYGSRSKWRRRRYGIHSDIADARSRR